MGVAASSDRRESGRRKGADLSLGEVADILGCHINTVSRLVKSQKLPAFRVGRLWRVTPSALREFRHQKREAEEEAERN